VAATDYVRLFADQIRPLCLVAWEPAGSAGGGPSREGMGTLQGSHVRRYVVLGTDGLVAAIGAVPAPLFRGRPAFHRAGALKALATKVPFPR